MMFGVFPCPIQGLRRFIVRRGRFRRRRFGRFLPLWYKPYNLKQNLDDEDYYLSPH